MPVQQEGMNIDPQILIRTQSLFISDARVKEVQMEAAIQQLLGENQQLHAQVQELSETQDDVQDETEQE